MIDPQYRETSVGTSDDCLRLLIVARRRFLRELLVNELRRAGAVEVIEATDVEEAVARALASGVELALVDGSLAGGPDLVRRLSSELGVRIIVLGCGDERRDLSLVAGGAVGFVGADMSAGEVVEVIGRIARGESALPPSLVLTLSDRARGLVDRERSLVEVGITSREAQILAMLGRGFSNKQIAHELQLELQTVKNHVHNILKKLGAHGRGEAVARAQDAERRQHRD